MPGPLIRRTLLSLLPFLWASSSSGPARAATSDEPHACVAGLRITIGPQTLPPEQAHRMLEQIVAELGPDKGGARDDGGCDEASTRIDVDVGEKETRVVIDAQSGAERRRIERTLDVSTIAPDGRALAVAIAVDEMAREAHEQLAIAPPPVVTPPAPPPPPPAIAARSTPPQGTFGIAAGMDLFTSGVTLLGPEARGALFLGSHVAAGARAAVLGATAWRGGMREAWSTGLSLAISPDVRARAGVAGEAAIDALVALAGAGEEATATVIPSIGVAAWLPLGGSFRLTLDARVGAPLGSLHAPREDRRAATPVSGAVVTPTVGVVTVF